MIALFLCWLLFDVISMNKWCPPPIKVSAFEYKFVF